MTNNVQSVMKSQYFLCFFCTSEALCVIHIRALGFLAIVFLDKLRGLYFTMTNNVQSVMKSQYWTLACAKKWLKVHNLKFLKVDVMPRYLWLRQFLPKRYKTYRIKKISPTISLALGY